MELPIVASLYRQRLSRDTIYRRRLVEYAMKSETRFYRNAANTKWLMRKNKAKAPKETFVEPSKILLPLMKGEAVGDYKLAVLIAVRNTIRLPAQYCKLHRAMSKSGSATEPAGPEAVRWSIFGAIDYVTFPHAPRSLRTEIIQLIKASASSNSMAKECLFKWEEDPGTTHSQVLHLLNMTIAGRKVTLGYK